MARRCPVAVTDMEADGGRCTQVLLAEPGGGFRELVSRAQGTQKRAAIDHGHEPIVDTAVEDNGRCIDITSTANQRDGGVAMRWILEYPAVTAITRLMAQVKPR